MVKLLLNNVLSTFPVQWLDDHFFMKRIWFILSIVENSLQNHFFLGGGGRIFIPGKWLIVLQISLQVFWITVTIVLCIIITMFAKMLFWLVSIFFDNLLVSADLSLCKKGISHLTGINLLHQVLDLLVLILFSFFEFRIQSMTIILNCEQSRTAAVAVLIIWLSFY